MVELDAGLFPKRRRREVPDRAVAGIAHRHLARRLPGVGQEFLQRVPGRVRVHGDGGRSALNWMMGWMSSWLNFASPMGLSVTSSTVTTARQPSGLALIISVQPMAPLAPGLFSTTMLRGMCVRPPRRRRAPRRRCRRRLERHDQLDLPAGKIRRHGRPAEQRQRGHRRRAARQDAAPHIVLTHLVSPCSLVLCCGDARHGSEAWPDGRAGGACNAAAGVRATAPAGLDQRMNWSA